MLIVALGWVGSALIVISLVQRDRRRLHSVNLASVLVLLAFNLQLEIMSMIVLNVVLALVNGYQLARRTHSGEDPGPPARPRGRELVAA